MTGWVVNGIHLEPVIPMKRWRVRYEGEMMMRSEGSITTLHRVKLDAVYTSDLDYFDFDSDMEPWAVARAMAREPWTREYFQRLKDAFRCAMPYLRHLDQHVGGRRSYLSSETDAVDQQPRSRLEMETTPEPPHQQ